MTKYLIIVITALSFMTFVPSDVIAGGSMKTRDYTVWPPAPPKTPNVVVNKNPPKPVVVNKKGIIYLTPRDIRGRYLLMERIRRTLTRR